MIIIAVCGRHDRGKTHSTICFHKLLLRNLDDLKVKYEQQFYDASGEDIRNIVKIEHGASICICSGGDDEETIIGNFKLARENNCDILISAVRHIRNNIPWYFDNAINDGELLIEFSTAYAVDKTSNHRVFTGNFFEKIHEMNAENIFNIVRSMLAQLRAFQ